MACQLVHTDFIHDHKLSYGGCTEDTGFPLLDKAMELGLQMTGWMPTRCARAAWASAFDNEFNRLKCVVYGDKMFHIGGMSRKATGRNIDPVGLYEEAVEMVLRRRGAEWILDESRNYHAYRFDKEAEVTDYKMKYLAEGMAEHLKTHHACFNTPGEDSDTENQEAG